MAKAKVKNTVRMSTPFTLSRVDIKKKKKIEENQINSSFPSHVNFSNYS